MSELQVADFPARDGPTELPGRCPEQCREPAGPVQGHLPLLSQPPPSPRAVFSTLQDITVWPQSHVLSACLRPASPSLVCSSFSSCCWRAAWTPAQPATPLPPIMSWWAGTVQLPCRPAVAHTAMGPSAESQACRAGREVFASVTLHPLCPVHAARSLCLLLMLFSCRRAVSTVRRLWGSRC